MSRRIVVALSGLVLFIAVFLVYFYIQDASIERQFRAARQGYTIELTSALPNTNAPIMTAPTPEPVVPSSTDTSTPSSSETNSSLLNPSPFQLLPAPNDPNAPIPSAPGTSLAPKPTDPIFRTAGLWSRVLLTEVGQITNASAVTSPAIMSKASSTSNASISGTPVPNAETSGGAVRPVAVESSAIILCYHQFLPAGGHSNNPYVMTADVFETEMKYLKDNGYNVVPLSDVVRFAKHEIGLPPHAVAITIDDGYKSVYLYAWPILKKYNFPWTFFCYPDYVNTGGGSISWAQLQELQAAGVDIESHSKSHPLLTHHGKHSPDEYEKWLQDETAGSKAILEQHLNKKILYFAYPYGDYNKHVEEVTAAAGYDAIFTVADNPVHSTTPVTSMGRYVITKAEEKNFVAYLHQGALSVSDAQPAPGATVSEPRPVISANLSYFGTLDPKSIVAEVRDFGRVHSDYDDKTSMVRVYLPRDLVSHVETVTIKAEDAETHQKLVALWHFNYEPNGPLTTTSPLSTPLPSSPAGDGSNATSASTSVTNSAPTSSSTNTAPTPTMKSMPNTPSEHGE